MTTTKRAYKLQEFVAHSLSVNCLKIGRKSSRVLVTGGEDHKVNLWAIGKPNAILSLSGHSSGIDSVSFDSSEVLVAAGAASGTIKLWDLEEAKIVRTLTGHRSNCISLDFHPFGEFFASGSLDTNLKIWDIRRKGCIHTYKGHTRGVNAIRFTPDGRWVVSGGEDNTLWDLTAGKLMHEFKCHEGQIQCIDFHPHEFLLATADLFSNSINMSRGHVSLFSQSNLTEIQNSGVMIGKNEPKATETCVPKILNFFNQDIPKFKSIFAVLINHAIFEMKMITSSADRTVKFWDLETFELIGSAGPETSGVRSMTFNPDGKTLLCGLHESMKGGPKLSDLNVHEGKLLGCSYNQSCVGVWVVDISRIEPYTIRTNTRLNGHSEVKSNSSTTLSGLAEDSAKASLGRISISQNSDPVKETKSFGRLSVSQNPDIQREPKSQASTGNVPGTPQRINLNVGQRATSVNSVAVPNMTSLKRNSVKVQSSTNSSAFNRSEVVPVIVQRNIIKLEQSAESRKEGVAAHFSNATGDPGRPTYSTESDIDVPKPAELIGIPERNIFPAIKNSAIGIAAPERNMKDDRHFPSLKLEMNTTAEPLARNQHENWRARPLVANWDKRERVTQFEGFAVSSPTGNLPAQSTLQANIVLADVMYFLTKQSDIITLDIYTSLLPLLSALLESNMDRHQDISLEMLLKLVKVFGSMIYSSRSAPASVGVDIEAEQRLERYNLCYVELEKVKYCLPTLTRDGPFMKSLRYALEHNCNAYEEGKPFVC
nr:katanin p80 WD40 repeat-containing subunit B1 homolog isoform X2 [Ipomoea trifida]